MPVDPFVAPGNSDRPRQQQNMPAGVIAPPSKSWRADRPGDLPNGQPSGPLFGDPGPNVGFARTIVARNKDRFDLGPEDHFADAAALVSELGMKRAASFGRAPVLADVERGMHVLGFAGPVTDDVRAWRSHVIHNADHDYLRRRTVVDSVPIEWLRGTGTATGDIDEIRALINAAIAPELMSEE
ncbi:MAG: hypothetical protein JWL73_3772 [Actinomycetia bacterium]|nr:hypothetical protein [Actinomycetes bacterium]